VTDVGASGAERRRPTDGSVADRMYVRKRASLGQRLLWRLEGFAFDALVGALRLMSVDTASAFGGWLVRTLGPLTPTHRVAESNTRIAFPDMPEPQRRALLARQWENTGRTFVELQMMDRLTPASGRLEIVGRERLDAIRESGKPVVFISGHFANFELMPAVILDAGIPCQITYRPTNNPYVDASMRKSRARYGVKLFAPKGEATRELLEALRRGESVALMNDQKFNQGLLVPFFGVPAATAPGPTRMALQNDTVLQPLSAQRLVGARFRITVHEPIVLERTGKKARDVEAGVEKVNAFVEARVREKPDDWFWVHKRWPNEIYAAVKR
jgi:KDO2-lipid IV(A) lauroyltransferase